MYIYTLTYLLMGLISVACLYMNSGLATGSGYQLEASSLGKTVSTTLNRLYLTVVLRIEAGPHEASIGVVIVQVLIRQLYCCSIIGIASLLFIEDTLLKQASGSSDSCNVSALFFNVP